MRLRQHEVNVGIWAAVAPADARHCCFDCARGNRLCACSSLCMRVAGRSSASPPTNPAARSSARMQECQPAHRQCPERVVKTVRVGQLKHAARGRSKRIRMAAAGHEEDCTPRDQTWAAESTVKVRVGQRRLGARRQQLEMFQCQQQRHGADTNLGCRACCRSGR